MQKNPESLDSIEVNNSIKSLDDRFSTIYGGSFDDIKTAGLYYCYDVDGQWCYLQVLKGTPDGDTTVKQVKFSNNSDKIETRYFRVNTWSAWNELAFKSDITAVIAKGIIGGNSTVELTLSNGAYMLYTTADNASVYSSVTYLGYNFTGTYSAKPIVSASGITITDNLSGGRIQITNNTDYNCSYSLQQVM